jgi:hypothetical protein
MPIQGTVPVGGSFAPTDGADSFGTHNDKWGVGGYRIVKTIADRDAIPVNESELLNLDDNLASGRRKLGMMVYVSDEAKLYVLTIAQATWDGYTESQKVTALATNTNFVEFVGGSGGGLLYGTTTYDGIETYTVTVDGTVSSYETGDSYLIKFDANNIGNTKLNINGVGEIRIYKDGSNFLEAGDIIADKIYLITYDGTNFQLVTLGGGSVSGNAGGDLSGTYPDPIVAKIQGSAVSTTAPTTGQTLQWNGTAWAPASIPTGGSGGGGVFYYFNFNTAADTPLTNIPTTPNTPKELGTLAETTPTSYQSANLSTGSYDFLASFVTDVSVPSSTTIPAGIWDFNIFAESTSTNAANQVYFQVEIFKYSNTNVLTSIASSSDVYIYDPTEINQYVASVIVPQTTILTTDRIVVYIYGRSHQNNKHLTLHFGGNYPSHVHTTLPSVTGTGFVTVTDGIFDSTATATIAVPKGGTGFTSYAVGDLLYANTTTSLAKLAGVATGSVLISGGVGAAPSWSTGPTLRSLILNNGTNANTITLNTGATAANYTLTLPTAAPAAGQYLQFAVDGVATWVNGTVTGVTTMAAIGAVSNANGASIASSTLTLQPANASFGGVVTTGTQTFAGVKTLTSPSITTSLVTSSTTFALVNTTATTLNIGGAATTFTLGGTPTTALTATLFGNATATGTTKTINIGTAGASGSTTNINIGSATSGALGTTTLSNPTTFNNSLTIAGNFVSGSFRIGTFTNSTFTTLRSGSSTTDKIITFPNATGTVALVDLAQSWNETQTFNKTLSINGNGTGAVFRFTSGGAAGYTTLSTLNTLDATVTFPVGSGTVALIGLAQTFSAAQTFSGGIVMSSAITGALSQDVFNTISTTVNFAGASTTLTIGATTGTATIRNATVNLSNATQLQVQGTKVVGTKITSWGTPGGTLTRATIAADAALATPTQAEFNALAQNVRALITDLRTHGLIGT